MHQSWTFKTKLNSKHLAGFVKKVPDLRALFDTNREAGENSAFENQKKICHCTDTVNTWTVWYHSMWVNVSLFGQDKTKNWERPLKAWISHRRCCVFVVIIQCIVLCLLQSVLLWERGHYRSAHESAAWVRFQAALQMGFSTPNLKITAQLSATRYGLANQNC